MLVWTGEYERGRVEPAVEWASCGGATWGEGIRRCLVCRPSLRLALSEPWPHPTLADTSLDIDYEYPKTASDAQAYVALLHETRAALEHLAQSKGKPQGQYQLTVAAPCGCDQVNVLRIQEMNQVLDFWNLMAYDVSSAGAERWACRRDEV